MNKIFLGDNLEIMKTLPDNLVDLIYIDPPFNTGNVQKGIQTKNHKIVNHVTEYIDYFENDFWLDFLYPRLVECYRLLKPNGSFYLHMDYREIHYARYWMDKIFGKESFLNEIIWSFDWGAKSKTRWSNKHNNILFYVKNPDDYYFNLDNCDRLEYLAPDFVGKDKAAKGKLPTTVMEDNSIEDVIWQTIVPTNSKERKDYAYPTQKPIKLIERFIKVSCPKNGIVMDCFAGSGVVGEAAKKHNRQYILIDSNPDSIDICKRRLE